MEEAIRSTAITIRTIVNRAYQLSGYPYGTNLPNDLLPYIEQALREQPNANSLKRAYEASQRDKQ